MKKNKDNEHQLTPRELRSRSLVGAVEDIQPVNERLVKLDQKEGEIHSPLVHSQRSKLVHSACEIRNAHAG